MGLCHKTFLMFLNYLNEFVDTILGTLLVSEITKYNHVFFPHVSVTR